MEDLRQAAQEKIDALSHKRAVAAEQRRQKDQELAQQRQEAYDLAVSESAERTEQFLAIMRESNVPQVVYCRSSLERNGVQYHLSVDNTAMTGWLAAEYYEYDKNHAINLQYDNYDIVTVPGVFVSEDGQLYSCRGERRLNGLNVVGNYSEYRAADPTLLGGQNANQRIIDRLARVLDPDGGYPVRIPDAEQLGPRTSNPSNW